MGWKPAFALLAVLLAAAACERVPYTGRWQFMMEDTGEEKTLGAASAREELRKSEVVTGTPQAAMVERVGKRLAAAAEEPEEGEPTPEKFNWQFHTVKDGEVNAACFPDGSVFVYTGLLDQVKSDDELAAVVGHEMAHAMAHHGAERMSQESLSSAVKELGSLTLSLAHVGSAGTIFNAAYGTSVKYGILLPFSRSHESEADYIGLVLMTRAGYDPAASVAFWERMAAEDGDSNAIARLRSTHPSDESRIEHLREILPEMDKYRPGGETPKGEGAKTQKERQ